MTASRGQGARARLAAATEALHSRLHAHPVLSRLARGPISRALYSDILRCYLHIYGQVEDRRARLGIFSELSLAPACAALRTDITGLRAPAWGGPTGAQDAVVVPPLAGAPAVLGALYVLHGAGFGGRSLAPAVARRLPGAPRAYLAAGTPRDLWRHLCRELDRCAADSAAEAEMTAAACAVFGAVDRGMTLRCRRPPPPLPLPGAAAMPPVPADFRAGPH